MPIITYEHHGKTVSIQEHLKGKHREYCLCHLGCVHFKPENRDLNCEIANANFNNCVKFHVVLPVWECPNYKK